MRVLIATGGTAGHINPALALARELLREPDNEIFFVADERGRQSETLSRAGYEFALLRVSGFSLKPGLKSAKALSQLAASLPAARRIVRNFRPDVCLGTGAYPSLPAALACVFAGVPLVIHEQNAVPGRANRMLAPYAKAIAVSYPATLGRLGKRRRTVLTGNPVRQGIRNIGRPDALAELGLPKDRPVLLVFGGSQGARRINQALAGLLAKGSPAGYRIIHISGSPDGALPTVDGSPDGYRHLEFSDRMEVLLSAASLAVCRAGASTIAELQEIGLPAILVPFPGAGSHQKENAAHLVKAGAAKILPDGELDRDGASLGRLIDSIIYNEEELSAMSRAMRESNLPDAAKRLKELLEDIAAGGPRTLGSA